MRKLPPYREFPLNNLSYSQEYSSDLQRPRADNSFTHQEITNEMSSENMEIRRSQYQKDPGGKSLEPLLAKNGNDGEDDEMGRNEFRNSITLCRSQDFSTNSSIRSTRPDKLKKMETLTRYKYAAFFLSLSLITFVIQTETAVYIQHELGWNKAYFMLYLTHGSWSLLWPLQLLFSKISQWDMPWKIFWRKNINLLRTTAQMVETQQAIVPRTQHSPIPYLIRTTSLITCALTIAGSSWYVAVNMTSPSDLTAIYNCSTFFAYVFSIPLLGERLRWNKTIAVIVAIVGVLVVAYGDSLPTKQGSKSGGAMGGDSGPEKKNSNHIAGNLIIGIGSLLYGFYEVLYKKLACSPDGTSAIRSMIFANAFASMIGIFTLSFLWIPIPILHFTGLEKFELPQGKTAWLLGISILSNAIFSGSFLILISLTSPVLSSVAALLTIFLVAIVDWLWSGVSLSSAAISGGILIISAFVVLSWSTYREMSDTKF